MSPSLRAVSRFGCVRLARWVRGVARSELEENYMLRRQVWAPLEILFLRERRKGEWGRIGKQEQTETERRGEKKKTRQTVRG